MLPAKIQEIISTSEFTNGLVVKGSYAFKGVSYCLRLIHSFEHKNLGAKQPSDTVSCTISLTNEQDRSIVVVIRLITDGRSLYFHSNVHNSLTTRVSFDSEKFVNYENATSLHTSLMDMLVLNQKELESKLLKDFAAERSRIDRLLADYAPE